MNKYFQKKWIDLKSKGHERITFMVIPHGNSNIVSIQLSKFTLFFAILISIMIVMASIVTTRLQENLQPEMSKLYDTYQVYYSEREQYIDKFVELSNYQAEFKKTLLHLLTEVGMEQDSNALLIGSEELQALAIDQLDGESERFAIIMRQLIEAKEKKTAMPATDYSGLVTEFEQAYSNQNFNYNADVINYRQLHLDVQQTERLLSIINDFISEREKVQRNIPYYWPIAGGRFTSFYGPRFSPFGLSSEFHLGVDLADATGTPIYAAASGRVIKVDFASGYGKRVVLEHNYGYTTVYAHMSRTLVKYGEYVHKGKIIGEVGQTGRATGPHLHFEVRINGKNVNPLPYLTTM